MNATEVKKSGREVTVSPEQAVAIDSLMQFIADPDPQYIEFVLEGFAGTGKTFCMREVVARCSKNKIKFAFTAPTNKAAKVLAEVVGSAGTIYSLLGLRIDKSGELKKLVTSVAPPDLSEFDVVFIDEGSMINSRLHDILLSQALDHNLKIIYMGDPCQLPPVGEIASPIWTVQSYHARLSTVMRHDNQILALVTNIRNQVESITPSINIVSSNANGEGVWKLSKAQFKNSIYAAAEGGDFADGAKSKVIAWRNQRVGEYNDLIRHAIYGAEAQRGFFMPGERIVAASPCMKGEESLLHTDDEAIVEKALACAHPIEPRYKAWELHCRTEMNRVIRLLVLHPESVERYERDSNELAAAARGNPKAWQKFWLHKELFHDVKYAYALTAHRSQGSTYENVWVDYQDVLLNRNRREAFQCLYVACSRPTTRLYLA